MSEWPSYVEYLRQHRRRCILTVIGSGCAFGWCVADLIAFSQGRWYWLHPISALFVALAALFLGIVGTTALWVNRRYQKGADR